MKDSVSLCRKLTGGVKPHLESKPLSPALGPIRTWAALQSSISPGEGLLLLQWDHTAKAVKVLAALGHHTHQRCSQHPAQLSRARAGLWSSPLHWHSCKHRFKFMCSNLLCLQVSFQCLSYPRAWAAWIFNYSDIVFS